MMNNLFSIFDPSSSFLSMNWLMVFTPLLLMKNYPMKKEVLMKKMTKMITNTINKEMEQLMTKKSMKMSSNFMCHVFMLTVVINTEALLPMNFTPTAHVSMTLPISLTLWLSTLMYGMSNSFKNLVMHFTPMGTPTPLMNFMVIIEVISCIIRPITLCVRLTANMVAGHLLVSLLSNFSLISPMTTSASMLIMVVLSMLETMVALVQAYVLTTLMTLYQNEA